MRIGGSLALNSLSTRDKSILVGLYLSKFDNIGLNLLGFDCFTEAFNAIGLAIGAKPASIKNYRDEFDPYHSNPRKGWHKRRIRPYCKEVLDKFNTYSLEEYYKVIESFLIDNYEIQKIVTDTKNISTTHSTIAKRLITGKSAEEFFRKNYHLSLEFANYQLLDTTNLACGFDFKLSRENMFHFYVEVKGLSDEHGSVLLTENEFNVAEHTKERYCLYLVRNFKEKPYPLLLFNPISSGLAIKQTKRTVIQTSYSMAIPKDIS